MYIAVGNRSIDRSNPLFAAFAAPSSRMLHWNFATRREHAVSPSPAYRLPGQLQFYRRLPCIILSHSFISPWVRARYTHPQDACRAEAKEDRSCRQSFRRYEVLFFNLISKALFYWLVECLTLMRLVCRQIVAHGPLRRASLRRKLLPHNREHIQPDHQVQWPGLCHRDRRYRRTGMPLPPTRGPGPADPRTGRVQYLELEALYRHPRLPHHILGHLPTVL